MNINITKVKIVVTVPKKYVNKLRTAMCNAGAGVIGNYTNCSMASIVIGTFKPNKKAKPFIGKSNKMEYVKETKLEVMCSIDSVKEVLKKLREVHPYEEPGIEIIPLIDEEYFK